MSQQCDAAAKTANVIFSSLKGDTESRLWDVINPLYPIIWNTVCMLGTIIQKGERQIGTSLEEDNEDVEESGNQLLPVCWKNMSREEITETHTKEVFK